MVSMLVLGLLLLFSSLLGGLFRLCLIDGCWGNEGDFFLVFLWHVHLESIRNSNASLGLVHLQEDADDPGDRAQGGVEHVAVLSGGVHLLGLPVAHPQPPRLVVKAVAAADKLPESSPPGNHASRSSFLEAALFKAPETIAT